MYSKTCVKRPLSKRPKFVFQYHMSLKAGQKYCKCSQYFRPSLSYHLSLRPLFFLFLSGRVTQVLLYIQAVNARGRLCIYAGESEYSLVAYVITNCIYWPNMFSCSKKKIKNQIPLLCIGLRYIWAST